MDIFGNNQKNNNQILNKSKIDMNSLIYRELKNIKYTDVYFMNKKLFLNCDYQDVLHFNIEETQIYDNNKLILKKGINKIDSEIIYFPKTTNFRKLRDIKEFNCDNCNGLLKKIIIFIDHTNFYNPSIPFDKKYIKYPNIINIKNLIITIIYKKDDYENESIFGYDIKTLLVRNDDEYKKFIDINDLYFYKKCHNHAISEDYSPYYGVYLCNITKFHNNICTLYSYNENEKSKKYQVTMETRRYFYVLNNTLYIILGIPINITVNNLEEVYIFDVVNFKIIANYYKYDQIINNVIIINNCIIDKYILDTINNIFTLLQIYINKDISINININIHKKKKEKLIDQDINLNLEYDLEDDLNIGNNLNKIEKKIEETTTW